MLKLVNIKKRYVMGDNYVDALKGLTITFRQSEFVSILGPSGCGKTTLLNIIGGLDHYSDGEMFIDNVSTKKYQDRDWDTYRNHRIGFVFQSYNLIPHQNILENVELALTISGMKKDERIKKAKAALDKVGLKDLYYKKPNQLSGGQCQRVAIARALVNNPEILLADEPTGALDTVTSVQIMDLIKEIASDTLVIMVTHNPELAERYSTRIVKLLDGKLVSDSNPYEVKSKNEVFDENGKKKRKGLFYLFDIIVKKYAKDKKNPEIAVKDLNVVPDTITKSEKSKNKSKLALTQAFRLSARNLWSKLKRTLMVCFAGSIGIIGVASVLSVSNGVTNYINNMQEDLLSCNPLIVAEESIDINSLVSNSSNQEKNDAIINSLEDGYINVNSVVEYLIKSSESIKSLKKTNHITEDYVNFVKLMPEDYYASIVYDYGISFKNNIYTSANFTHQDENKILALSVIENTYKALLMETEYKDYASLISSYTDNLMQLPNNEDFIMNQYEFVTEDSRFAKNENELVLVLDRNENISDLFLAQFGYFSQEEFLNIIYHATEDPRANEELYKNTMSFKLDDLMNKTFTYYPNDIILEEQTNPYLTQVNPFTYNAYLDKDKSGGIDLKIVGILKPKDNLSYGTLESGLYYTESLVDKALKLSKDSKIAKFLSQEKYLEDGLTSTNYNGMNIGITYELSYFNDVDKVINAFVGSNNMMTSLMNSLAQLNLPEMYTLTLRDVGGNDLASIISIYPSDFQSKDLVTTYLDRWNSNETIDLGNKVLVSSAREEITYTDNLSIIISLINNMITMVTTALVAFTALSLVVSTVMIAIITYVSVIERIKEIGVIRSLGGRKKDVSRLFNAEAFIIGLVSGLIGVGITYLLSFILNMIVGSLSGIYTIASLPFGVAIIMVIISIALTSISGLIPARAAAKKDPVEALRSE